MYHCEIKVWIATDARRARRFEAAGNCVCNGTPRNRKRIRYTSVVTGSMRNRRKQRVARKWRVTSDPSRRTLWVNEWREKTLEISGNGDTHISGVCVRVGKERLKLPGMQNAGQQK